MPNPAADRRGEDDHEHYQATSHAHYQRTGCGRLFPIPFARVQTWTVIDRRRADGDLKPVHLACRDRGRRRVPDGALVCCRSTQLPASVRVPPAPIAHSWQLVPTGMPLTFAASWVPQPIERYITVAVMPCDCPVTVCHGPAGGAGELGARLTRSAAGSSPSRRPPNTPAAMISAAATPRLASRQRRRRRRAAVRSMHGGQQLTRRLGLPWPTAARLAALAGGPSLAASAMASSAATRASRAGSPASPASSSRQSRQVGQVAVYQRALGRVDGAEHVDAERQPGLRQQSMAAARHGASPRS